MKVIGYIRVSTDKQDLEKQRHLLLEYAQHKQWIINCFIEAEVSSLRNTKERKIDELLSVLDAGDILLVAELSTTGPHTKLLLAIYSYFAESEREYISIRTKQGLAAAKAKGKLLGRPVGSRNKNRVLDPYLKQIKHYLQMGLNLASIRKIINNQLENAISYNSFKYFVQHDEGLRVLWEAQKQGMN